MYLEFSSSFHVKCKTKLTATLTTDSHVCRFPIATIEGTGV